MSCSERRSVRGGTEYAFYICASQMNEQELERVHATKNAVKGGRIYNGEDCVDVGDAAAATRRCGCIVELLKAGANVNELFDGRLVER